MKGETIIISDIKLFSKEIVLGAYTFSRKKNFHESIAILPTVHDIKNQKSQNCGVWRNLSYVVCRHLRPSLDPSPKPCVEISRQTEFNRSKSNNFWKRYEFFCSYQ